MTQFFHEPVMVEEVCRFLLCGDGVYVDATIGGGGHARAFLERLGQNSVLVGIDRDREALEVAQKTLSSFAPRVLLVHGRFSELRKVLDSLGIPKVRGIFFDLGVSSWQLEEGRRGFSFSKEGPLDMRMDASSGKTAYDLLHSLSEEELADLFFRFGEERYARHVARTIVAYRRKKPITTTTELASLVSRVIPRRRMHPATRIFLALRIAVNEELDELEKGLRELPDVLEEGGRVVVLSYHSLEDRLVKRFFRECPVLRSITKKPVLPSQEEVCRNPRARSARLRAAEKVCLEVVS
ncbi:MAG: 16S rRNA (cytosine(1402)-N(4))-methyltransferase RsmH [Atribacterota bacterium]